MLIKFFAPITYAGENTAVVRESHSNGSTETISFAPTVDNPGYSYTVALTDDVGGVSVRENFPHGLSDYNTYYGKLTGYSNGGSFTIANDRTAGTVDGVTYPPVSESFEWVFTSSVVSTGLLTLFSDNRGGPFLSNNADASLFGTTTTDPTNVAGQVYALYEAILRRAPDPTGFESSVAMLNKGVSVDEFAQGVLSSAEYTADYGAAAQRTPTDFVTTLYRNALGRSPEADGLQGWNTLLANGTTEAQVARGIALSPESIGRIRPTFQAPAGVFVPDEADSSVARLYYALLNRAPDSAGLRSSENLVRQGTPLADVANSIMASSEYLRTFANQSNTTFVQTLYLDALGRAPDPGGSQAWVGALDAGATRASVTVGIAESQEARVFLAANIEIGHRIV